MKGKVTRMQARGGKLNAMSKPQNSHQGNNSSVMAAAKGENLTQKKEMKIKIPTYMAT
jgi:hypothetical protein